MSSQPSWTQKSRPWWPVGIKGRVSGVAGLLFVLLACDAAQAQTDLTTVNLADLMNIEVTSVSKKGQKLSRTASAVFSITQEDIRRSGATSIPDLLRMVPGMDVAQITANTWAISSRGLNGRYSNELLVLLDGRNVYTPTFGGVEWDLLDVPLEDIDRIEVIRGPGGTIWGANAVNGVVNIITKKASETKGAMAVAVGGNLDQGLGTVQYGGSLGKGTNYRVFTKYFNQNHMPALDGAGKEDGWHMLRGGFRMDSSLTTKDTVTTQGDIYTGAEGSNGPYLASITSPLSHVTSVVPVGGGYVQSTWSHVFSERSDTTLQASYDQYKRDDEVRDDRRTFNLSFKHHFAWGGRQDIVWGADFTASNSQAQGGLTVSMNPAKSNLQQGSVFIQDEFALVPDRLYVTAGARLDHDYYTGLTVLPGARLTWSPSAREMFWAATSRAERMPAQLDTSIRSNSGGFVGQEGVPTLVSVLGNPKAKNEGLVAYEAGYRKTLFEHLSVDLSAYFNNYDHQDTTEPAAPYFENTPAPAHLVIPLVFRNLMHGESHGLELGVNWKATDRWTLSPGYGLEHVHMHLDPTSKDTGSVLGAEGNSPVHSAQLRSHLEMSRGLAWDASAYFVDRLRSGPSPSYTRVDTGITWQLAERVSLSLVGQNLVKDRHLEFVDDTGSVLPTLVKRSGYAKVTWTF